jgi:hypothetical protein
VDLIPEKDLLTKFYVDNLPSSSNKENIIKQVNIGYDSLIKQVIINQHQQIKKEAGLYGIDWEAVDFVKIKYDIKKDGIMEASKKSKLFFDYQGYHFYFYILCIKFDN